jgi:DNA mismatch repair ATPase MutL
MVNVHTIEIRVTDSGIGIREEDKGLLLTAFGKID